MASHEPTTRRRSLAGILFPLLAILAWSGCDTGPAESLYTPDDPSKPDPVVTAVEPAGSALAGVDIIRLTGQNFSAVAEENYVYFGPKRGTLISATPTTIEVRSPATPGDDIPIRVQVIGAENFSDAVDYRLEAAYEVFGAIGKVEELRSMTTDAAGNMYVSMVSGGTSVGFKKIAPDGSRSDFAASTFQWNGIAAGSDGRLYGARNLRAVFRFAEGGAQETWVTLTPTTVRISALAFDANGNLWAGGANTEIFRLAPDKTVARFPFDGVVTAIRPFAGHLYVVAQVAGSYGVWRFPMDGAGNLGTASLYFDIAANVGAAATSEALAFAADGSMYVGTDQADPVVIVAPGGASHSILYPGVMRQPVVGGTQVPPSPVLDLAWGPDPFLYAIQARPVGTLAGDAVPMIRINTRKSGSR